MIGCSKVRRVACRNWRSRPWRPAGAVLGVAGDRVVDGGEMDADLVGSAGIEAGSKQGVCRQQLDHLEVGARLARAGAPTALRVRRRRWRPSGASIGAAARVELPSTRADVLACRPPLALDLRREGRMRVARCARPPSGPEVSRSSRCTIPGRSASPPPRRPRRASRRGSACCGTAPGGRRGRPACQTAISARRPCGRPAVSAQSADSASGRAVENEQPRPRRRSPRRRG